MQVANKNNVQSSERVFSRENMRSQTKWCLKIPTYIWPKVMINFVDLEALFEV